MTKHAKPRSPRLEELEPRLLLSADPLSASLASATTQLEDASASIVEYVTDLAPISADSAAPGAPYGPPGSGAPYAVEEMRLELVFVDTGVEGYEQLLADLEGSDPSGRHLEVMLLDADRDGIEQITSALSDYTNVDAVHILSHGNDTGMQLGDTWLSQDNLTEYSHALSSWNAALSADADLLFYGCNLAADEDGLALIDGVAQLTGADVAASDDLTGNAVLGGDWELEHRVGAIESTIVLSADAQSSFNQVLVTYTVTTNAALGPGSLADAIDQANASTAVDDVIEFNIGGGGAQTITVDPVGLPEISDTLTIDATTQPGYAGEPLIILDGSAANPGVNGIVLSGTADSSVVRGLAIVDFPGHGISVKSGADFVTIAGNWIGTAGTGTTGVGNGNDGIDLRGSNATIGGLGANDGNVITNSGDEGINIVGSGVTGHVIQGNVIGLDPDGASGTGNADVGIAIISGSGNTIGGTTKEARNIISNNFEGIEVNTDDNVVAGNYIGTDITGVLDRGNRSDDGVEVQSGATGNVIGGTAVGAGNRIAFNARDGVFIASGSGNAVLGNEIFSNSNLGIDIGPNGVNTNDGSKPGGSANLGMDYPVLEAASLSGSTLNVDGYVGSAANQSTFANVRVEIFKTDSDPGAVGDARTYLGFLTTDANGNFVGSISYTGLSVGDRIIATATDSSNNTSEFGLVALIDNFGTAIWRENGSSVLQTSDFDGTTFGTEELAANVGSWRIMQGAESPHRDEKIVVGVDSGGDITGMIWDGTSWSALPMNALATVSQTSWWGFDVKYEQQSGDAVLVWANGNTGTEGLSYAEWDGTSWSTPETVTTPVSGTVRHMQLASSPTTDEMILVVSDASSNDYALVWDGDTWGNSVTIDSGSGDDRTDINVAYESQSGHAVVVNGLGGANLVTRTWDGGSWSTAVAQPPPAGVTGNVTWTTVASDPNSDQIAVGVLTNNSEMWVSVWDGNLWQDRTLVSTSATGTTHPAIAVAFESDSGDALAAYGESGSSSVKYRTWSSGGGWSSEQVGPNVGGVPNSLLLDADPATNRVMLSVQDIGSDVNFVLWDGSGWGTPTEHEVDTGETKNQPFLFLWDSVNAPPITTGDVANTNENTAVVIDVLANDTDPESDPMTARVITGPSNGTLVPNPVEFVNETNLTNDLGNDREADWSPDGSKIAFRSDRDGNNEIYVMDADGSNVVRLTNDAGADARPVWSPDGTRIAFNSDRDGNTEIYVMDVDGSNQTRLTTDAASDEAPTWSPDGTKIAFKSTRDGNEEIYVMNADGTGQTNITSNSAKDSGPSWSPDGSKILFASDRDGNTELYVMDTDGSNPVRLTNDAATDSNGSWSPDGSKIVFKSNRDGNHEIYVMDADGSNQVRLTNETAPDGAPTWSPDASKIAFQSSRTGNHEIYVTEILSDGTFTYTPDAGFTGVDSFTYVANDGTGDSIITTATITVNALNDAPTFGVGVSTLDGNPTFVEDGAAVILDSDVNVSDTELDALNGGLGNYDGASLTLVRNGGASAEDVFAFNDGNGITFSGGNLIKNSQIIATFDITTTPGELVLTFTDANSEIPISADVDKILHQITYTNSSNAPPATVRVDWTFDDGNTGAQGGGGALQANGSTTVNITATDDPSVISGTFTGAVLEGNVGDAPVTAVGTLFISDVDPGDNPVFNDVGGTVGDNGFGSFELVSGTWTYTLNQSAVQDLDVGDIVNDTITYTASDLSTQVITVTITGTGDASVISGTVTGAVNEGNVGDAPVTATGAISISDADADDSPTIADVVATVGDNGFGSFELVSGTWTYTLDQSAVQDLDAGDVVNDTITYTASDLSTQAITVTITGTNDAPALHSWYDSDWDFRKTVTIDSAQIVADLTDFPVLITLTVEPDLAANAQADGDDIFFTSADGTKLAHEIDSYDSGTGALRTWVKTDLSASSDTAVFLYYGNDTVGTQADATNVWTEGYVGVYHLGESPTGAAGDIRDSTSNNNHGTTLGSMDSADSVGAVTGNGLEFDGVDDYIRIADSPSLDSLNDKATFSLWINFVDSADGGTQLIMSSSNRYSEINGYEWASQNDGEHFFYPDAGLPDTNFNLGPDPFTNGQWHHLAATMDFATKTVEIYVDGAPMTLSTEGVPGSWTELTSSDDLLWGGNPDRATRYFAGMMDEIRISDVVRSQEWIQTEINNQSAPAGFVNLGTEESRDLVLSPINEDDFTSPGDTVQSILTSGGGNVISDVDAAAVEGIAVVGVDDTDGEWQFDAAADGTWVAFGSVSDSSAVLLNTDSKVRFVPDPDYNGPAGNLTFRAWDRTTGAVGNTGVDLSTNGGTTAYSSDTAVMSLNVLPVNDPSVISGTFSGAVSEGDIGDALVTATGSISISDIDVGDNPSFADVASTVGDNSFGSFELVGGTWTYTLDQSAVQELRVGDVVNDTITYTATDGTTQQISVSITGTNDLPVVAEDGYIVNEDATLVIDWFDTDWSARRTLTFDNSGQTETLPDFPVLVVLDAGNIDYTKTQDDGSDLRFFAADGSALSYDIEEWNEGGTSYVWVKVSQITGGSNGDFVTMYYGNAAALAGENPEAVWSNGFAAVQHLNDGFVDATGNSNDGVNSGSTTAAAQVADGQLFDGVDDYVDLGSDASIDDIFAGGGTVSAWINPKSWGEGGFGRLFDKADTTFPNAGWALELSQPTQSLLFQQGHTGSIGSWFSASNSISLDTWQQVTVSYDSSSPANTPEFYVNGVLVGTVINAAPTGTAVGDAPFDLRIGNFSSATTRTFDGTIDDARVSSDVRSADWIKAQFLSSSNAFVTFGGEETAPAVGGVLGNDDDVDVDGLTVTLETGPSNAAAFTLNKDGTFSYSPTANFNGVDSFTYRVNDGSVDSSIATVTITVTPQPDAPSVSGADTGVVTEDTGVVGGNLVASGTLTINDPDAGESSFIASTINGTFGDLSIDTAGNWSYSADNSQSGVQGLGAGDLATDVLTVTTADGSSHDVTITINGTEDAPNITGSFTGSVNEGNVGDAPVTATGSLGITDADADDTPVFNDVGATVGDSGFGSFVLTSGTWTYTLDQSAVQDLDAGDVVNDTITYTASDLSTQVITVTITGTDDVSVTTGTVTGAVNEGNVGDAPVTATGAISISDVDADDSPTIADVGSTVGDNGFGSFELVSGTWTYTLDQSAVQDLDAGDIVNDTITFTASDLSTQVITVTITGTNDTSVISGTVTGAMNEGDVGDAPVTAMGAVSILDADDDDSPTIADVPSTMGDNGFGSFELVSGTWTYTLDQSAVQSLDAGDVVNDTITYTASDLSTQIITVTITGTDDTSVISGTVIGAVNEGNVGDAPVTATGAISIGDVDADDSPTIADVGSTVGDNGFGSFELVSGTWTYTLDQSAVQDLDAGDVVNDTITYTASDLSTQIIAVTIAGTEDTPVIGGTDTGSVTQDVDPDLDGLLETAGTLTVADPDVGESSFNAGTITGTFGDLTIDASGNWTYEADNSQVAIQALGASDSVTDIINVTSADGTGHNVVITINGSDNPAVIGGTDTESVVEDVDPDMDGLLEVTGSLTITDPDVGQDSFNAGTISGTFGDLTIDGSGNWSYEADNTQPAIQNLGVGGSLNDVLTVQSVDGTTHNVTITINGADDASVISGTVTGAVNEGNVGDAPLTATGAISIGDVDADDSPTIADVGSTVGDNGFGSFELVSGTWTYTLDQSAVQNLDAGDVVNDTITYIASDLSTQVITVTITGTDDVSVITGTVTGAVNEGDIGDAPVTATGAISILDADDDDSPTIADVASTVGDNGFGSFELVSGTWTYTLNQSAVQDLDAGDIVNDTITYTASDLSTQVITVTITGTDDASVISGTVTGAVNEGDIGDAPVTATGAISISDADADDSPTIADVASTAGGNGFGSFELVSGTWTYTLDQSAVQNLDAGDVVNDTITYTASDLSTQVITVTITGTDDVSVITGTVTGAVNEGDIGDAPVTATGVISVSDVDADDSPTIANVGPTVGDNGFGSFELVGGSWSYTLDQSAVQDLDAGDIVNDTITYTASDLSTQVITVTITGTDDASVISGTVTGAVNEGDIGDAPVTATGAISISDADADDSPTIADVASTAGGNGFGSFELVSGTWTYTLDQSAVQNLDAGDVVNDTITYTASDLSTQVITVTITGTDDVSVITGTVTGAVNEGDIGDAPVTATGAISILDADDDDSPTIADVASTVGDNGFGGFELVSGTWTYTLDQSALQDLDAGDVVNDTITFTASDLSTQVITVTITGTDDASVISGTVTGAVNEGNVGDAPVTATGAITIADADANDSPTIADVANTVGDNGYGSFELVGGTWTYTLDQSAAQNLDAGDVVNDTITYTASDLSTQVITVTISGTNDASVISGTVTGAVNEGDVGDAPVTATGAISVSDADADDNPTIADVGPTAGDNGFGSFALTAGTWTYTLDESAVQELDAGDVVTDTTTYTATDGSIQQITITITGRDDTARVFGIVTGLVTEGDAGDAPVTATGSISISDVDADDSPLLNDLASTVGDNGFGSFDLTGGTWTYILDQSTVQGLDIGDTVNDTITLTATDGSTHSITVTIAGTEDAPIISGVDSGGVAEDDDPNLDGLLQAGGTLIASDADSGESGFAPATVAGAFGSLSIDGSGNWTYTADNTQFGIQSLDVGQSVTDTVTVSTVDGTTRDITVIFSGTEDAAIISGTFASAVIEGDVGAAPVTVTGRLSISDVDSADSPAFADVPVILGDNQLGSFELSAGTWTYTLDQSAVQQLGVGDSATDTTTFTATDGTTQQVTVTIDGADEGSPGAGAPASDPPADEGSPIGPDPLAANVPPAQPATSDLELAVETKQSTSAEAQDASAQAPESMVALNTESQLFGGSDPTRTSLQGAAVNVEPASALSSAREAAKVDDSSRRGAQDAARADYLRVLEFLKNKLDESGDELKELELTQLHLDEIRHNSALSDALFRALDTMGEEMDESLEAAVASEELMVRIAKGAGISLSTGYLTWLLRAGSLLGGLMSSMPLWSRMDPLPVVVLDDDERKRRQRVARSTESDDEGEIEVAKLLRGQARSSSDGRVVDA